MPFDGLSQLVSPITVNQRLTLWDRVLRVVSLASPPPTPIVLLPTEDTELLMKAKLLIQDERNWTQGNYEHGSGRCAVGALRTAAKIMDVSVESAHQRMVTVVQAMGYQTVERMNDDNRHTTVMQAFEAAITNSYEPYFTT